MAPIWAQNVAWILAFDPKWAQHSLPKPAQNLGLLKKSTLGTSPTTWPNNIWHIASAWPTIARLSFNISHKMAKLGPRMTPIWLPLVNLPQRSKKHSGGFQSPNWLLHRKLCSFSNQTTSTFWQISLDNPQTKLMHPKSCGVDGCRHEASGIMPL